jgi:hypothetical protein
MAIGWHYQKRHRHVRLQLAFAATPIAHRQKRNQASRPSCAGPVARRERSDLELRCASEHYYTCRFVLPKV